MGVEVKTKYIRFYNAQDWDIPKGWHVYRGEFTAPKPHSISASKEYDPRKKDRYIGQAIKRVDPNSMGKTRLVVEVTHGCD